jgi:hypothetical protein
MRKLKKMLILFAASLLFFISFGPTSADADLYKYIDKKGTIHFTDSYESIPPEYRDQIKIIKEPSPTSSKPAEGQAEKEIKEIEELKKKEAALRAAQEKEAQEREAQERKLRARQEKEKQVEEIRRQIEAKQSEQRTLYSNPLMVRDRNQFLLLNQEINGLYQQIQVLQSELDAEQ